MVQKSQGQPPGICKNPLNNGDKLPTSTGELIPDFNQESNRMFQKSQMFQKMEAKRVNLRSFPKSTSPQNKKN